MALISGKCKKSLSITLFFCFFPPQAFSQSLSEQIINLEAGQWTHQQSTYIGGRKHGILDLSGSECLTENGANLSIQDYVNKMMSGVGEDANCEFSNIETQEGRVDFDITCSNSIGVTTSLSVFYNHSPSEVSYEASGTVTGHGNSQAIRMEGNTNLIGECE